MKAFTTCHRLRGTGALPRRPEGRSHKCAFRKASTRSCLYLHKIRLGLRRKAGGGGGACDQGQYFCTLEHKQWSECRGALNRVVKRSALIPQALLFVVT